MGSKPEVLHLDDMTEKGLFDRKEVESFGLFDSSQPNYTTYYPDLNLDDLKPKDEEFVYPVYRLLSAMTLPTMNGPLSFEKPGVLKNSIPLILGQSVNVDHEMAVGNAVGAVVEAAWQNAYTLPNGLKVPAGINGTFKIDGKSNPRLARGIMMNPPSIHSNSVTVNFAWEQSHPKMSADEFQAKLGKEGPDGKMVKMVATEIFYYLETSLVPHGRDPFAKKIGDGGKIEGQNIAKQHAERIASIQNSMSWKQLTSYQLQESFSDTNYNNLNNKPMEINALLAEFGIEATDENIIEVLRVQLANAKAAKETIENLTLTIGEKETEVETLTSQITEKETEIEALNTKLTAYVESENGNLSLKREEAVKFYKLVKGEKSDDKIISAINESAPELADSFLTQYREEFEALSPLTCQDCNSHNVSRATAVAPDPENPVGKSKALTAFELKEEIQREHSGKFNHLS